ncbi:Uma2 family endonuclease [Thermoanaerobacter sp. CM-CNRG TB177]|uniref:Uma2 family endonuclease n=1 Tax=Thermoanaerobacter pentosaceus TaxID=694059 RepID=A0ABT9M121_9THEO|nr:MULTISPECIES: Uma2 family endonuclease [Thermoanaerobacter]MBT1278432.1 Uma2 family endonuclease [Thermoanaerobacter sp. CM-CNRG TB177]MDP9749795.1 Uma2 family endonuclease [Thermoanaerobacter pentosaceus]
MPLPEKNKKYTYADYLTWSEEERWEIINGVPHLQAAPTWQHQAVLLELARQFANYLQDKSCRVFTAPFDLRIPEANEKDEETTNVVQPDIIIICDNSGLKKTGYYGVPELIIEVVSPSTGQKDKIEKFNLYEKAGVKEYWIVEPDEKVVMVFTLEEGRYGRPQMYSEEDKVKVSIFDNLVIELKPVFERI